MLSFQIYATSDQETLLADYSSRVAGAGGLTFGTNAHGFSSLNAPLVAMDLAEAFEVYEWPGTPHVVVSDQATGVAWEGRLEDITIVPGGVALTALGYQRALYDVPYTALWSRTTTAGWREVTDDERGPARPQQYEMDNNNRLYIAPKKGEVFANAAANVGELTYLAPNYTPAIAKFTADYDLLLPSGWKMRLITCDSDFDNLVVDATVTATGSAQSGSWSISTSARQRIVFSITNDSGSSTTISADTGDNYARLTNIRIKATTAATVPASSIVAAIGPSFVNSVNSSQLAADTGLIETTTTDLQDEVYEDLYPSAIFDRLALLHTYEWGVWEGHRLHFRPKGSAGRHWFVDVSQILELQRSLENIRNSAYAVYRLANGETARTAAAEDTGSQDRYGVVRRGFVSVQTTSSTEATTHRDTWLADRADLVIRARILFDRLYDAAGSEAALYELRSGDTVTMRNLPPTISTEVDRIRTFVVGETSYNAGTNRIDIAPDAPVPTLVTLIAQQGAGIS